MKNPARSVTVFLLLAGLGLVGNGWHMPLFFGVDFLSGNIFVFLALALLGTWAGTGVAALAGASTYVLWGHPHAWLGMVIQAVLVGVAIRYKRDARLPRNMPAWVASYWLLLGLPLIAGLYHHALGLGWQGALLVAFKQAVNDVLNALVAALALSYLPVRRWCGLPAVERGISLRGMQTNLLAAFAFFPALVVIALLSRAEVAAVEEAIKTRLAVRSTAMRLHAQEWIDGHMQIAQLLAQQVAPGQSLTDAALHRDLRFFVAASPDVAAIRVVDAAGRGVLSTDEAPGTQGADFSDSEWFQRLQADRAPGLALIPQGRPLSEPLVVFVAPLLQGAGAAASLRGGVVLTYKVRSFQNMFSTDVLEDRMRATLLGRDGRVIFSSEPRFAPGQAFEPQRGGIVAERMGEVYRWQPHDAKSKIQGWGASYYVQHVALGNSGWRLVVELPLKSYFVALEQKVLQGFIVIFALVLGAFLVGGWLGRRIVQPLKELGLVSTHLARNIAGDENMRLQHHGLSEIDALVDNFRDMATSLKQNYCELLAVRRDLEQRVQARTADLIRQAAELERSRDEAQSASCAKTEFLSSMSHEMRTPMNAILGFSQFLQMENLSDEHKMSVNEIYKAGMHLLALIDEVLNLAKIESGHLDLSLEPVELAPLVDECLVLVNGLAAKRHITLACGALVGAAVRADRVRLKQVLLNLLSNAIKYNREGGSVTLAVEARDAQRLRIRVTDTGLGIAAGRLHELFQPFSRLGAENGPIEGTGIGLTITRRMVEMMDGAVDVESQEGVGSTFWIELPRETGAAPAAGQASPDAGAAPQSDEALAGRHTVLYIEDNPINLKLVEHILARRKNVRVLSAHTPELGIELARTNRPELILLDINMPGLDGYQVLKTFQADANLKDIPVVAVTANALPRDIERGKAAGFDDYLTKPLDIARFNLVLDQLLGTEPQSAAKDVQPAVLAAPAKAGADNWERF